MARRLNVHPDHAKANEILASAEKSLKRVNSTNFKEYPSDITKDYYEIIRKLISIVALLDGYRFFGDGSHLELIKYVEKNYRFIQTSEIQLMLNLREARNKVMYDGFEVLPEYIKPKKYFIIKIINKLRNMIKKRIK